MQGYISLLLKTHPPTTQAQEQEHRRNPTTHARHELPRRPIPTSSHIHSHRNGKLRASPKEHKRTPTSQPRLHHPIRDAATTRRRTLNTQKKNKTLTPYKPRDGKNLMAGRPPFFFENHPASF